LRGFDLLFPVAGGFFLIRALVFPGAYLAGVLADKFRHIFVRFAQALSMSKKHILQSLEQISLQSHLGLLGQLFCQFHHPRAQKQTDIVVWFGPFRSSLRIASVVSARAGWSACFVATLFRLSSFLKGTPIFFGCSLRARAAFHLVFSKPRLAPAFSFVHLAHLIYCERQAYFI